MIPSIKALTKVCDRMGIRYIFLDRNRNAVRIDPHFYFINSGTPWNDEGFEVLAKDKEFTYHALKDVLRLPRTIGFFDPARNDFKEYRTHHSIDEILREIDRNFSYPVMIKRNRGLEGKGIFKCTTRDEARVAIVSIFNPHSKEYDYVALAQEYVYIRTEYRVTVCNNVVELIYESPTHSKNGACSIIPLTDPRSKKISRYLAPVFSKINVMWSGIDIAEDENGELYLLELNTKPGFTYFISHNGDAEIMRLYEKMLGLYFYKKMHPLLSAVKVNSN
jgi:glutathione synthase/RimK-type ligase-like ATP-grasp enzyme